MGIKNNVMMTEADFADEPITSLASPGFMFPLDVRDLSNDKDGVRFVNLSDSVFDNNDFFSVVPAGFIFDLASIPSVFLPLFPKIGSWDHPALHHDWVFCDHSLPFKRTSKFFRAMLDAKGTSRWRRPLMEMAVDTWIAEKAYRIKEPDFVHEMQVLAQEARDRFDRGVRRRLI